jgi:hypothetical protein
MSTFILKGQPPIKLQDLLKKKKMSLKSFVNSTGIVTYQKLQEKCQKLGVSPPSEEEFKNVVPVLVSSPQEGVVVLDPPALTKDSGEKISVDSFIGHVVPSSEVKTVMFSTDAETKTKQNKPKQKKNR